MTISLFIIGLVGLFVAANLVVTPSKTIAKRLGVSQLLIGLTIISIGTSLPEIMVSIFSGIKDTPGLAVGTTIGSGLTQITLILGVAGLIHKIKASRKALRIDGTMVLVAIFIYWFFGFTGHAFSQLEGIVLILLYIGYLIFTAKHDVLAKERKKEVKEVVDLKFSQGIIFNLILLMGGVSVLLFSSDLVTNNAVKIAQFYGLSESFIGVMIIGVASCLPELSTAIAGVINKAPGISIGTLIGSNITTPLLSIGAGAVIGGFSVDSNLLYFDIPFWFISSVLALLLLHRKKLTLNRYEASILVCVYIVFIIAKFKFFV